jgi:hypothetical protein
MNPLAMDRQLAALVPVDRPRRTFKQIQGRLLMGVTPSVSIVMAGLRPGHPRLSHFDHRQDVDARHKAGHDG